MKDIFIPIILFITTIMAAVFFITKIYKPQQDTIEVLAENSQNSSFAVTYIADGNDETVSGAVVKSTIDYYSVDNKKEVCVQKNENIAKYKISKYNEGTDSGGMIAIGNSEEYKREVIRDEDTKEIESIWFRLK